jgi:hypothetical protein
MFQQQQLFQIQSVMMEVADYLAGKLQSLQGEGFRPLSRTAAYVITLSLLGTLRAISQDFSPLSGTDELKNELLHLVLSMMRSGPSDRV